MRVMVLGPAGLRLGFAAAGAEFVEVVTPQEALQCVMDVSSRGNIAAILIATTIAAPLRGDLDRIRALRPVPAILEIPDLAQEAPSRPDLLASVATSFGIQM